MKKSIAVMLVLLGAPLAAQDFNSWKSAERSAFSDYISAQDRAFIGYLDQQWKEFKAFDGVVRDPVPKPPSMPEVPVEEVPGDTPPVVLTPPETEPERPPARPPMVAPGLPVIKVQFFGDTLSLPRIDALHEIADGGPRSKAISDFWRSAAAAPTQPLLEVMARIRDEHLLNDWALLLLVDDYAAQVFPHNSNQRVLLQWFLLTKLGYRCKVGLAGERVLLYMPVQQMVYGRPYLNIGEQRYFIDLLSPDSKANSLTTYEGDFPGADRVLDLAADNTMMRAPRWQPRQLEFSYNGQPYQLTVNYDANKIDFLHTYPQTDFPFYFSSGVTSRTEAELKAQLSELLVGKDEHEAVNFLLRFVQTSFDYKTDRDSFGFENYLLVEETLHYPASDCEDRSVLFAWLVRELLGLEVVGLLYPGHVATAVRFGEPLAGGQLRWQGKTLNVADPTFINADAGMVMPQFQGVDPEIIVINQRASR